MPFNFIAPCHELCRGHCVSAAKSETHLQVFDDNSQLSVPEWPFTELCLFTPEQGVSQDPTKNPGLNLSELISQEPYITAASFCSKSYCSWDLQTVFQLCQCQKGTPAPGKIWNAHFKDGPARQQWGIVQWWCPIAGNQGTWGFEPAPPLAPIISSNLRQAILKALRALSQVYKTGRINSYFIDVLKEHKPKRGNSWTYVSMFSQNSR